MSNSHKKMMVVNLSIRHDQDKVKALTYVSGFVGVDSTSWDTKGEQKKLTVIGDIDPVSIVNKLRTRFHTELAIVGPAPAEKEPEKKKEEPAKKEEPKKESFYPYPH